MLNIRSILMPTDFSDTAATALQLACSLARDHGAKLVLMTAPAAPLPVVETYIPESELNDVIHTAKSRLDSMVPGLVGLEVETCVKLGEAGWAIVAAAEERDVDLIVMGTHGRTGVPRLILGSVAEHVMRHATCPVLTVKPQALAWVQVSETSTAACVPE